MERKWWVIDAEDKPLGRLASDIANVLRGKHKPTFTPHVDTGDFVIVVNAKKVQAHRAQARPEAVLRHSGDPGGFRTETYGPRARAQARGARSRRP